LLKNIWISEWERTFKRKKTWVGIIIYFVLVGLEALFLYGVDGVSFYNAEKAVPLNSLNTAPFFLRELGLFLIFIIIPMFVVDSFNGEYRSGAYRLILLRPQGRLTLLAVKISIQGIIILGLLTVTGITATVVGKAIFPTVHETTFLNTDFLNPLQASLFILVFYLIAFFIMLAVILISSAISSLMPNSILAYLGTVGLLIGSIYVSDYFIFFLSVSDTIFEIMGYQQLTVLLIIVSIILVSYIISVLAWKKRDWLG
jgi:ABC-2 type transport system permease protein